MTAVLAGSEQTHPESGDPTGLAGVLTRLYANLLVAGLALTPVYLIAYVRFFQDPALKFEDHTFHVIAISAATVSGLFIAYVTWCCYRSSREPLLRWMTLGFLGFTLIYALHGAFTGFAHDNIWLFLLYGPASRLVMAILLLVALLSYHRPPDARDQRTTPRQWMAWVSLFLLIDVAVAVLAHSPIAGSPAVRLSLEGGALAVSMVSVAVVLMRHPRSLLMDIFVISVLAFALSSLAFILGSPWNHMWWLAHVIFAGGFFLLSYGVVHAFHTTRSFATIYSHDETLVRLAEARARTDAALRELQRANQELERLASTDPLTGADNRRRFVEHVEAEFLRVQRGGAPFCVLAIDLDNFKSINDRYGHQVGDDILKEFVRTCLGAIRPYDGVSRVGGEEFTVLLPEATLEVASIIAERLRATVASHAFESGTHQLKDVRVSIGIAQSGRDGDTMIEILRVADQRLYSAKGQGRDRVISG